MSPLCFSLNYNKVHFSMWCSERYLEAYGFHAALKVVEGENHTITRCRKQVVGETVAFFRGVFGR